MFLNGTRKAFYRAVYGIFGRIGRIASEQVILQLISYKCVPILLCGLEACPLNTSELKSIEFTLIRFMMKLFRTSSREVVADCLSYFGFMLPSMLLERGRNKFLDKVKSMSNLLCTL